MKVSVWVRQLSEFSNVKTEANVDDDGSFESNEMEIENYASIVFLPYPRSGPWVGHPHPYKKRPSGPSFDRYATTTSFLLIYLT